MDMTEMGVPAYPEFTRAPMAHEVEKESEPATMAVGDSGAQARSNVRKKEPVDPQPRRLLLRRYPSVRSLLLL
ncbi:MAG: hypothetical protein QOG43_1158 [Actinomycetota bacterium]|jgi:hypothetical protein|nr:hypothetical protein [Actinomycetota bacterium]